MASKEMQHGYEVWTIGSPDGGTRASFVPEKGGTGSSLIVRGRELLFLHDYFQDRQTERIPGGWPFLFPICGRLERGGEAGRYLLDGRTYRLPSHGFGPRMPWQVIESERADTLVMKLAYSEETLVAYPFRFEVTLAYRVEDGVLVCEQAYRNCGGVPMPYYAGFHPYFLTPEPGAGKESVVLDFSPTGAFRYNERFTDLVGPVGQRNRICPAGDMAAYLGAGCRFVRQDDAGEAQRPPVRLPAVFAGHGSSVTVVWHKTEGVLRKSAESFKVRHRFADKKNVLLT